ncbi:serine/threonine protein kinase [Myxococcus stipitatus DSM 14675]|uniref:Serine/threonine protein kinase n=1 Tax=Myxococcus stipitatus (strain DSM 14675 / JCM 12634 / Mx s8) TaxID=1278073 RepID=L7UD68_MYXSD|nr:serine/threonine-protein kinase [Myxococcus stipitatus]AGC45542.1 serine/threonine protein kinase [Myxococcus stipitatus DSM 14675]
MAQERYPRLGRYELLALLGRGGMAETWRARLVGAAGVTKPILIKKVLPEYANNAEFISLFISEARISSTLSHGNIAQVFEFGRVDQEYFLAMELVEGQPLHRVMKRAARLGMTRLPVPLATFIALEMCRGLHYAHTRTDEKGAPLGIVHRDVSPDNVIISYEGQVKIVDFGIAKARLSRNFETEPGIVRGKYLYFSPEQARGQEVDARTDIWTIGLVLYEMLCGQLPVTGTAESVMSRMAYGEFPTPRQVCGVVPVELESLVMKALSVEVPLRYASANAFADALASYLYSLSPPFSSMDLTHLVRALFQQELVADGRELPVPKAFLQEFSAWCGATPISRAPSRAAAPQTMALGASQAEATTSEHLRPTNPMTMVLDARPAPKPPPSIALDEDDVPTVYLEPTTISAPEHLSRIRIENVPLSERRTVLMPREPPRWKRVVGTTAMVLFVLLGIAIPWVAVFRSQPSETPASPGPPQAEAVPPSEGLRPQHVVEYPVKGFLLEADRDVILIPSSFRAFGALNPAEAYSLVDVSTQGRGEDPSVLPTDMEPLNVFFLLSGDSGQLPQKARLGEVPTSPKVIVGAQEVAIFRFGPTPSGAMPERHIRLNGPTPEPSRSFHFRPEVEGPRLNHALVLKGLDPLATYTLNLATTSREALLHGAGAGPATRVACVEWRPEEPPKPDTAKVLPRVQFLLEVGTQRRVQGVPGLLCAFVDDGPEGNSGALEVRIDEAPPVKRPKPSASGSYVPRSP